MGVKWWRWLMCGVVLWSSQAGPSGEISPALLGMYRKTMELEGALIREATQYQVDLRLVRAVVIQESGGNIRAEEQSAVHVVPGSARGECASQTLDDVMRGVQRVAELQQRFERDDQVLAAYYAGSDSGNGESPSLGTLKHVIDTEYYQSLFQRHEPEIRTQAELLRLRSVQVGESWDTLAQTTGVTRSVLQLYNPCLASRPLGQDMLVVYPSAAQPHLLRQAEGQSYYLSRLGDTPIRLAQTFGVDPDLFQNANDLWYLQELPVGTRLITAIRPLKAPSAGSLASPVRRHKVRRGDTLGKIARRYGTSVAALMRANGLKRANLIQVGKWLKVPPGRSVPRRSVTKKAQRHKIRGGETLWNIARRYGTSVAALMRANKLKRADMVKAGSWLEIPATNSSGGIAPQASRRHKVKRGETLGKIAKRYQTSVKALMRANNLRSSRIYVGAFLWIP